MPSARTGTEDAPSGWAAVRNRAADGEWGQFTREDVEGLVRGVRQVVAGCEDRRALSG